MPLYPDCRAFTECHVGTFSESVARDQKPLGVPGNVEHGHTHATLEMAYRTLRHKDEAREVLAKDEALDRVAMLIGVARDPSSAWFDWLFATLQVDKAVTLTEQRSLVANGAPSISGRVEECCKKKNG